MTGETAAFLPRATRRALPGMLFALLLCAVYFDPLFTGRIFGGPDPLGYNLPVESAIHDAYARHRLPVWSPGISGGRPLMPNPNTGALYPVRPLLALLPLPLAFRIFPLLHWALAGIGMMALLRRLPVSPGGAWIGAVTYVFSGVGVSEVFYSTNQPGVMLLPWILWAFARPFGSAARKTLALSILFGLDFLAGDVFTIGIALGSCVLWILLEVERRERLWLSATLAASLVMAALLASPQIVATLLWIPETRRALLGMRLSEAVFFSVSPFRLLELVIPFPFGAVWDLDKTQIWGWPLYHYKQLGFFSSLYAGAFAVIAVVGTRRLRVSGARFARALLAAGLAGCVLPSLLPARWGGMHSPLPLRSPEKFAVSLVLALAILAGLAFDLFRRSPAKVSWTIGVGALLTLLAAGTFLFPEPSGRFAVSLIGADGRYAGTAARLVPWALAEGGLLWIATVIALDLAGRRSRRALGLSLALLTLVPIAADRRIARTFSEDELIAPTPFARFLRHADPDGAFRTLGESNYRPPSALEAAQAGSDADGIQYTRNNWDLLTHLLWGRGTVFNIDFDAGDFFRAESLRRLSFPAAGSPDSEAFFGALALRWGIRYRDQQPLPGYHRFGGNALLDWDEHDRAYPDIRLLERWREESGALPAAKLLPFLKDGEVVIESGLKAAGSARPGQRLRLLEKKPERLSVETETEDPTWLFVLRGYWSYRTILLDGGPAEDAPAQLAFSAVRVPAGRHRIEWIEEVPGGRVSRWGPVLYALLAAGILASERRRSATA